MCWELKVRTLNNDAALILNIAMHLENAWPVVQPFVRPFVRSRLWTASEMNFYSDIQFSNYRFILFCFHTWWYVGGWMRSIETRQKEREERRGFTFSYYNSTFSYSAWFGSRPLHPHYSGTPTDHPTLEIQSRRRYTGETPWHQGFLLRDNFSSVLNKSQPAAEATDNKGRVLIQRTRRYTYSEVDGQPTTDKSARWREEGWKKSAFVMILKEKAITI